MKNKIWMILAALFVVAMIGAVYLYGSLSENYAPNNMADAVIPNNQNQPASQDTEKPDDAAQPETIPAPDVKFTDADGNEVKLSDYFGKPIVFNLWASWCGPCKMEMPHFEAAMEKYGEEVQFILINIDDDLETVKKFLDDNGYPFEAYLDKDYEVSYNYSTGSIPVTYFIDKDGNVVTGYLGAIPEETLHECIGLIYDGE